MMLANQIMSKTGAIRGKNNWKIKRFGSAKNPNHGAFRLKRASACFRITCSVPNIQRKRCLENALMLSGASVMAMAHSSCTMR